MHNYRRVLDMLMPTPKSSFQRLYSKLYQKEGRLPPQHYSAFQGDGFTEHIPHN